MSNINLYIKARASATVVFEQDYQNILTYATSKGYALPSSAQQIKQNNLVKSLKLNGIWRKLDSLSILATDGSSLFALIDWIRISEMTAVNSPVFTVNQGFQGNGTSSHIRTNFAPINGNNYKLNDASIGGWYSNALTRTNDGISMGQRTSGNNNSSSISPYRPSQAVTGLNNNLGLDVPAYTPANGLFSLNRFNSSNYNFYLNNSLINTSNFPSNAVLSSTDYALFGFNSGGTVSSFSNDKMLMHYAGASLEINQSAFYNSLNTYFNSL
tara:strand:- start:251 stop:1060 length:810 start_codon:yes stop_codon:yes gene_type:complete